MASTGKRSKKKNKTTLSLNDFLGDASAPNVIKPTLDWADESDETLINSSLSYQSSANKVITLPTAPRAARSIEIDQSRIPDSGPFTAYVGNLPYDANQYMLEEFFKDIEVLNVRLPEENGRFKGFGYVQFADKQGLIKALQMNDEVLERRTIRIDIAGNQKESGSSWGRSNSGGYRSESRSGPDPTESNWRKAASDNAESSQEQSRGYADRHESGGYHFEQRGGYNDRNRSGAYRSGGSLFGDKNSYSRGGQRSQSEAPRQRPQLNLQKRQKPIEDNSPTARSSSIFGSAKPVDTSARERAIEQKLSTQEKVEVQEPVKKPSTNIFGEAKPVDTSAKDRETEKKIAEQEKIMMEKVQMPRSPPQQSTRISVFGGAKPVDTSARDREIEEKIRRQDEAVYAHKNIVESVERRPRRTSEQSEGGRSSPHRRSRTSSTRSSDDHEVAPHTTKSYSSGEVDGKKPEYKPAPAPKQNAWGRKLTTGSRSSESDLDQGSSYSSSSRRQWNQDSTRTEVRGEREEAEGNEEEGQERKPEGAANEGKVNRFGDGSESNQDYNSRRRVGSRRNFDNPRQYNNDHYRDGADRQRYYDDRKSYRGDNRRRGDGDSESSRRNYGTSDRQYNNGRHRDNDNPRRHDLDPRPECDRPEGAVDHEKPIKLRRPVVKLVVEEPIEFSTQSKFAMLTVDDSDDES